MISLLQQILKGKKIVRELFEGRGLGGGEKGVLRKRA